uniref:Phosphodiesterase 2A n=1 Tax=Cairina moschata TaxID=8855 RepID=A0A8C3CH31_CAIMO
MHAHTAAQTHAHTPHACTYTPLHKQIHCCMHTCHVYACTHCCTKHMHTAAGAHAMCMHSVAKACTQWCTPLHAHPAACTPCCMHTLLHARTPLHAQRLLQTERRPPPHYPHAWGASRWSGGLPAFRPARGAPSPRPPLTLPPAADDVSVLLQEIITEARNLSNAEICSVFLLDRLSHELVAKVFDGGVVDDESYEIRIPADQGIAGHVATTGKILNIKDAYSHPLFYRGVDDSTGFRTRNILCFPIKNESQEVIGVAELVNKINGPWFSKFDEDLATAFSIYCGISIAHSLLYKKVNEAQYRSHLANEMMMYHMKVRGVPPRGAMRPRGGGPLPGQGQADPGCPSLQKSVLAALYSSEGSVMERHHFAQAIAILNSQGCNIFDHFSRKDYQRMLDLMRDIILATDLAHHLRIFKDLQKMAEGGEGAARTLPGGSRYPPKLGGGAQGGLAAGHREQRARTLPPR